MSNPTNRQTASRRATEVAATNPSEAVGILARALEVARQQQRRDDIASLAQQAGTITHAMGSLDAAAGFFAELVAASPEDPHSHLALAGVLVELGRNDAARSALIDCTNVASPDDVDLVLVANDMIRRLDSGGQQS